MTFDIGWTKIGGLQRYMEAKGVPRPSIPHPHTKELTLAHNSLILLRCHLIVILYCA